MLIVRCVQLAAVPAFLVALGCASTSSTVPDPAAATESAAHVAESNEDSRDVAMRPVYFGTDRAQLRPETRVALKGYAKSILDHPEWGVLTIEGHCDERGSDEYNLALGESRATGVQRYLMDLGVPAARLSARTLGEEKPAITGHEESAWRYNRRAELRVDAFQSSNR